MPDSLDQTLRDRFGLPGFHPWQREAIDAVLAPGGRVLVVAPTGGGKSLTYQFPAAVLPGTTLVISPLVALMEDQVRALEARGIPATFLASTLEPDARRAREIGVRQGRYKLVYVAPERLAFDGFVDLFARMNVPLIAVDEAHCISQWGHDFRPDYLRLGEVIARVKPARVLACTATATPEVRREIRERLNFDPATSREILRGFARPNLHLSARAVEGPTEARKLLEAELARALGSQVRPGGAAIAYAATRKATEQLSAHLRASGWNSLAYHAGMEGDARARVNEKFARREVDVVVATNAFGMGIDRPDIRTVVHFQPPASIEAYYQEVGRAGRDGRQASGLLLCSGMDIALRRRLCQLGSDGAPAEPALVERSWGLFRELLRYLDACTCRHDFVLRYFGDERELLGGCGHCDVCAEIDASPQDVESDAVRAEEALVVRKALSAVARARQRAGVQAVAEMLVGARTARTERFGFTTLSTFALLKDQPHEWVVSLLRGLIAAGWIDLTPTEHPVPFVTASGWEVMKSTGPVRFRAPRARRPRRAGRTSSPGAGHGSAAVAVPGSDPAMFEKLRSFRAALAKEKGVPVYVIALDRTLHELAARKPSRIDQLPEIYGLGPARIELYGEPLLRVLRGEG